jgi:hypothetical protein
MPCKSIFYQNPFYRLLHVSQRTGRARLASLSFAGKIFDLELLAQLLLAYGQAAGKQYKYRPGQTIDINLRAL